MFNLSRPILMMSLSITAYTSVCRAQLETEGAFELQIKSDRVLWQGGAKNLSLNEMGFLNQGLKGKIEGLKGSVQWDSLTLKSQGLAFSNLSIAFTGQRWAIADGALLKLSCTDLTVALKIDSVNLPWGQVQAELASGIGRLSLERLNLDPSALEGWIQTLLDPSHLSFEAKCPGNAKSLLENILRSRLESFLADSNSATRQKLAQDLKTRIESVFANQSISFEAIFKQQKVLAELLKPTNGRFLLTLSGEVWAISGLPRIHLGSDVLGFAAPLKPSEWRVFVGTKNLNQSLKSLSQGLDYKTVGAGFVLDKPFRVKDFATILPELSGENPDSVFKFRLKPALCSSQKRSVPSLTPFVSKTGLRRGFDAHIGLNVELINASNTVISERHLPDLGLELFVRQDRGWSLGSVWIEDYNDDEIPCDHQSIAALPFELALSVEMSLESPDVRASLKKLVTSMTVSQAQWAEPPIFWGQTSRSPRARGGFFASGIILSGTGF